MVNLIIKINSYLLKVLKFSIVGLFITGFITICYYIFLDILNWPLYPTFVGFYLLGVFISYLVNSRFTFNKGYNKSSMAKFYLVYIINLGIGIGLLKLVTEYLNFSNFHSILIIMPPRILFTFLLSNFFVFK